MSTLDDLSRHGIIPVVVIDDASRAVDLGTALVDGGLPVAEVTFRTAAAPEAIARMRSAHPTLLVGAGTVVSAEQVDRAVDSGAQYVVSPGLSLEVLERCAHHGVAALPGAITATEVMAAVAAGATIVKFFPAGVSGGVAGIAALSAPFPGLRFVPTGGVELANLADYLRVPSVAAVGGSWMVPRASIASGDVDTIRDFVAQSVSAVTALRAIHR